MSHYLSQYFRKPMIFLFALSLLIVAGCGTDRTNGTESSAVGPDEKKVEKSGKLTVYTALIEDEAAFLLGEFEKASGVDVNFIRLSAGEILARLQAEKNNPQASVWLGGSSDTFIAASNQELLEKYTAAGIDMIPKEYNDPTGHWTPVTVGAIAFVSNSDWLASHNMAPPASWEDLKKPEFKDQIAMAHPATSGTSFTTLSTVVQLLGEEEAYSYLKEMNHNIRQYTKSGSAPVRMAGLGEVAVGIAFTQDILQAKSQGYKLTMSFPSEGTGFEVSAAALIKGAPANELENAKKFMDWVISKDAQNLLKESYRLPVHPAADTPEGAVKLSEITLIEYDAEWAGERRKDLISRFETQIKGKEDVK
ncbi:ABC transporter substrate-binding protein [Paenibacillus sp.]|uniref:ABC transporter substrate-binding protein n=1 Tax=Paenibacillus sp. TaxID=58172 RepID=UPI0028126F83|nr:ABC transporter substrate-binding protein [Paenibacillus sp.]